MFTTNFIISSTDSTTTDSTPAFRSTVTSCPDFSVSVAPSGEKEPTDSTSLSGTTNTSAPSLNFSTFILPLNSSHSSGSNSSLRLGTRFVGGTFSLAVLGVAFIVSDLHSLYKHTAAVTSI